MFIHLDTMGPKIRSKPCIVHSCSNTTLKSPEKDVLLVPENDKVLRTKWLEVCEKSHISETTRSLYVCEDHFNLEEDLENFMRVKLIGGRKKLKPGVIPHIFPSQLETKRQLETVATASHAQASSSTNPLSISEKDLKIEVDEEKIYDPFTRDYIDYPNNRKKARIGEGIPTKVTSVKQEDDQLEVETITVKKETNHDIAEYVSVDQIKMESEMSF